MTPSDRPSSVAIRTSADLFEAGRWDAAFHVASAQHGPAMEALKARFTPEQAMQALDVLAPAELARLLEPLRRGNPLRPAEIERLAGAHPYLVLALVQDALPTLQAQAAEQAAQIQQKAVALNELSERMTPTSATRPKP